MVAIRLRPNILESADPLLKLYAFMLFPFCPEWPLVDGGHLLGHEADHPSGTSQGNFGEMSGQGPFSFHNPPSTKGSSSKVDYLPVNSGFRFSKKAFRAPLKSSVVMQRVCK